MTWYWEGEEGMLNPVNLYRAYAEILIEALEEWLDAEDRQGA